ncbi:MAG: hypothetical protein SFH39_05675 [Candidatus Magnetobacterium sp. LHC-1]|uniref:Tetratricopeptide repeat protein n=1 Tax=Candidatus Magnetobacterium casense TaxID=1455061 RepID=A0ABS6RXM2_9BACT|nr:hypothetical protein [Candidatus Magnetobacterium casensis]MBF0606067.1 hypothetical protein [Nitrospirota bacterium]MBV6341003.1 hypothetical protein [Candidatus Magnetobacterium casensis]
MNGLSSVEVIMNVFSEEVKEALEVLCVPNMLEDSLAESLLQNTGRANGNASAIIKRLRSFPIWHYRTIRTWAFHDDIRQYCIGKLNGSGKDIRTKVLSTLREKRKDFKDFIAFDISDYDLQVARLAFTIEEEKPKAVEGMRAIFDLAAQYNESETARVIDLYLEEDMSAAEQTGESLSVYVLMAFFMRGMYAHRKKDHDKALRFMMPVWEKRHNTVAGRHDAAIAAHIVGLIWSKERNRWQEAERAYKSSLTLCEGNVFDKIKVCTSFGKFLLRDKRDYSRAREHIEFALEHERDARYREQLVSLFEELDRAEDSDS